jgi:hypothetical protein
MTRNKLSDLNNHLFEQLERLNDVEEDALADEIERSKAVSGIAKNIIENGKLVLEAEKFFGDHIDADKKAPRMLTGTEDNETK